MSDLWENNCMQTNKQKYKDNIKGKNKKKCAALFVAVCTVRPSCGPPTAAVLVVYVARQSFLYFKAPSGCPLLHLLENRGSDKEKKGYVLQHLQCLQCHTIWIQLPMHYSCAENAFVFHLWLCKSWVSLMDTFISCSMPGCWTFCITCTQDCTVYTVYCKKKRLQSVWLIQYPLLFSAQRPREPCSCKLDRQV